MLKKVIFFKGIAMLVHKHGNIFTTECQTLVNTVNCVGVMGAGIAYEFRLRHPNMYTKYQELCKEKHIAIGKLWLYRTDTISILNFPTKEDWKYPSRKEFLHKGLQKFVQTYQDKGITSIAFPLLGADKGGIAPSESLAIMTQHLEKCSIPVEIWSFDPSAKDDLYEQFKTTFMSKEDEMLKKESGIQINLIKKVRSAMAEPSINSLSGVLRIKGVGEATLEKLFHYIMHYKSPPTLFDL